jgi:NAD(P)-dependent dehydrogenase (short-subunit alcohol dehydrogenase family)
MVPISSPSDMLNVRDRTVLLTGGGRGLGRTMASGLAAAGARLIIVGRDFVTLSRAAKELKEESGAEVYCAPADLSNRNSTLAMVRHVLKEHGHVDILVHNAGFEGIQPIESVTEETMDNVLATNFVSAVLMTRAFVPGMRKNKWGRLVYVVSATTMASGANGHSIYTASKTALEGFSRTLAIELGRSGITSNCLSPGTYLTDQAKNVMAQAGDEGAKAIYDMFASMSAVGRWGNPEDLIAPLLLLISDHARFVTGEVLRVDGGLAVKLYPS